MHANEKIPAQLRPDRLPARWALPSARQTTHATENGADLKARSLLGSDGVRSTRPRQAELDRRKPMPT